MSHWTRWWYLEVDLLSHMICNRTLTAINMLYIVNKMDSYNSNSSAFMNILLSLPQQCGTVHLLVCGYKVIHMGLECIFLMAM